MSEKLADWYPLGIVALIVGLIGLWVYFMTQVPR